MAFTEGESPGKHLHEDSVFNWLRRAGGPYLVAFNEGKPAGRHLHEDGVGNWLRRAGGPYLVAFNEAEPPGKHLHEDGGPYLVAFNEGEPPGKHLHEDGVFNWLPRAGVLIWWHLMKENHLASTCRRTVFSIGYE